MKLRCSPLEYNPCWREASFRSQVHALMIMVSACYIGVFKMLCINYPLLNHRMFNLRVESFVVIRIGISQIPSQLTLIFFYLGQLMDCAKV